MLSWTVYVVPFLQGNPHPRIEIAFTVGEEAGLLVVRPWIFRFSELLLLCPGQSRSFGAARQWGPGHVRFAIHVKGKPAHAGNEPENGINAAHILCHILDTLPDGRVNEELVANFPILGTGNESTNVVCADAWAKGKQGAGILKNFPGTLNLSRPMLKTALKRRGSCKCGKRTSL